MPFTCPVDECDTELSSLHATHFEYTHGITPFGWLREYRTDEIVDEYEKGFTHAEIAAKYPWLSERRVRNVLRDAGSDISRGPSVVDIRQQIESVIDHHSVSYDDARVVYDQAFERLRRDSPTTDSVDQLRSKAVLLLRAEITSDTSVGPYTVPSSDVYPDSEQWLARTARERGLHPLKLRGIFQQKRAEVSQKAPDATPEVLDRIAMKLIPSSTQSDKVMDLDPETSRFAVDVPETDRTVRSKLERTVDQLLHDSEFDYEYEPKAFDLPSGKGYLPDFVVDDEIVIEVKGNADERSVEKATDFMSTYQGLVYVVVGDVLPCDWYLPFDAIDELTGLLDTLINDPQSASFGQDVDEYIDA
jgi:hypothetical protein